MSFFEDLVDRAGRLLGIVTTTGQATIATEATAQTLATEATLAGVATEATAQTLATQATAATLGTETTLATRASEATALTLATQATLATRASETTLATRASEATVATLATQATLATRASEATLASLAAGIASGVTITGRNGADTAALAATVSSSRALNIRIAEPLSAFGEVRTVSPVPRVQIDGIYGFLTDDHEQFTATGGSVTFASSLISCASGTSVGGYGVLRSRRLIRYRAGQGILSRFTSTFTAGVALSTQGAGMFTSTDGLFFGYNGATFGLTRRIAGRSQIVRLTITTGATGAGNITVTLNSVAFVVAVGGALSTTATSELIAESGLFTGWTFSSSPTSNGATVTFIQASPAAAGGTYSLSSTAGAVGTFATLQTGAANDDATGFVPQASWNADTLDGSGDMGNPSGVLLDPTKLNVYQITLPYLGSGAIVWGVMLPDGSMSTVHVTRYPNSATAPNQVNPTYRVGWFAASLGSSGTNLVVTGASAAGFVEGETRSARDPFSASFLTAAATTTETVSLAFRVRGEFTGRTSLREVRPNSVSVGVETASRVVRVRLLLNPTLTGTVNWSYVDQATSVVERATPTSLTPTGGRELVMSLAVSASVTTIDLSTLDLRLEPGDVMVIDLTTTTSTATCQVSMNWQEV